jgi:acetoin utilization deacetylase AcuC-like enzyme
MRKATGTHRQYVVTTPRADNVRVEMAVLYVTHPVYCEHVAGRGHPERPERLLAVEVGAEEVGLGDTLVPTRPRLATKAEIQRIHSPEYIDALEQFCEAGGGLLDGDTAAVPESWEAALLAAGAGLTAAEKLRAGDAGAAFCAVRPPGHHAVATHAMGFCLFNNVAVTAAALAADGDRVLIVDFDAHHGNGTQDSFYARDDVAYVSFHQSPLYPGTGSLLETGEDEGRGFTVNLPLPPGTTGDVYRDAIERVVVPLAEEHRPDWLLLSAGFDAHRRDPLTDLGLTAGDFADISTDLLTLAPPGHRIAFLEGGYDIEALRLSSAATLAAMEGEKIHEEPPTSSGPGADIPPLAARARLRGD